MNRKTFSWLAQGAITAVQLLATKVAFAANLTLPNPIGCGTFGCVVKNIINLLYTIAIPLCTIMVLWGGFTLLTSSGDPEKTKTGRNTILYAVVGFAVILFAKAVPAFIQAFFK
jgi:NAD dependent epimerase/dehydratase family enzyme